MRERRALYKLRKVSATQAALQVASQAALAHALEVERLRDADVRNAEDRLRDSIEDWRGALAGGHVEVSLLRLFAQAPPLRKSEVKAAQVQLEKAQRQTALHRTRHGESCARLRRSLTLQRRLAKRLSRKLEDKALAALEHQSREPAS